MWELNNKLLANKALDDKYLWFSKGPMPTFILLTESDTMLQYK